MMGAAQQTLMWSPPFSDIYLSGGTAARPAVDIGTNQALALLGGDRPLGDVGGDFPPAALPRGGGQNRSQRLDDHAGQHAYADHGDHEVLCHDVEKVVHGISPGTSRAINRPKSANDDKWLFVSRHKDFPIVRSRFGTLTSGFPIS